MPEARISSSMLHSFICKGLCDTIQPFCPCRSAVSRTNDRCTSAEPPTSHPLMCLRPLNWLISAKGAANDCVLSAAARAKHSATMHSGIALPGIGVASARAGTSHVTRRFRDVKPFSVGGPPYRMVPDTGHTHTRREFPDRPLLTHADTRTHTPLGGRWLLPSRRWSGGDACLRVAMCRIT